MRVHEPQAAKPPHPTAQAADLRDHQPARVAHDHAFDDPATGQEHSQLPAELARQCRQMACELAGDQLVGAYATTKRSQERLTLRGLESANVAV